MTNHRISQRAYVAIIVAVFVVSCMGGFIAAPSAWGQTLDNGSFQRRTTRPDLPNPHDAFVGDTIRYRVRWTEPGDEEPDTARVALYRRTPYIAENRVRTIELDDDGTDPSAGQLWSADADGADTPWGAHLVRFEFLFDDAANRYLEVTSRLDVNSPPNGFSFWMDPEPYGRMSEAAAGQNPWSPPDPPNGRCVANDTSTIYLWVEISDPDRDAIGEVEFRLSLNGTPVADPPYNGWQPMTRDPDQDRRAHPGRYWAAIDTSQLEPSDSDTNSWRVYEWEVRAYDGPGNTYLPNVPSEARPTPRRSDWRHDESGDQAPSSLNFWISDKKPVLVSVNDNNVEYPYPVITPDDSYAGSMGSGSSSSKYDFRIRYSHVDGLWPRGLEARRSRNDDDWLPLWSIETDPWDPVDENINNPHALRDARLDNPNTYPWVRPMVVVIDGEEHFAVLDRTTAGQSSTDFGSYNSDRWGDENVGIVFRYTVEPTHGNWDAFHPSANPRSLADAMRQLRTLVSPPILSKTAWEAGTPFRNMFTGFGNPLYVSGGTSQPFTLRQGELDYFGRTTCDYLPLPAAGPVQHQTVDVYSFEVDGALSQGGYAATMLDGETPSWAPHMDVAPQVLDRASGISAQRDYWPNPNLNHSRTRSTDTYNFWVRAHDYQGVAPDYVRLHIGGNQHYMNPDPDVDDDYAEGGVWYRHTLSGLSPGTHSFRFESNNTSRSAHYPDRDGGTLGMLQVNNRPTVSDGKVTPATGQEGTTYVYEVTYRDADGDPPHQAYCNIFDPSENSGSRKVTGRTRTVDVGTIEDDGASWEPDALINRWVKITSSNVGPEVTAMGQYFRITNNRETTLTVKLPDRLAYNYTETKDAFDAIAVGDGYRIVRRGQMVPHQPSSPSEADFRNGVVYRYVQNQLSNDLPEPKEYRYAFTFQDRWETPANPQDFMGPWFPYHEPGEFASLPDGNDFGVAGSMIGGPTIEAMNVPPQLSDPSVDPVEGTTNDTYRFEVTFTDANNDVPTAINLRTSSTADSDGPDFGTFGNPVGMTEADPTDLVTTDGKRYYAEIKLPLGDSYAFTMRATDGTAGSDETTYDYTTGETPFEKHDGKTGVFGPTVGPNTAPMIDDVNFNIADGQPSSEMFFQTEVGQTEVPESPFAMLDEVTWYLEYRDEDGHAPKDGFPKLVFDNVEYTMEKVWAQDEDYRAEESNFPRALPDDNPEGVRYRFSNADLNDGAWALGSHSYYFLANDGEDQVRLPAAGTYTLEIVNTFPVLSEPSVSPVLGTENNTYTYQVTYTDADNHPPTEIRLLTSTNADPDAPDFGLFQEPQDLEEVDPSDTDYTDGKLYAVQMPAPPIGIRNAFTFEANDGTADADYGEGFEQIDMVYGAFGPRVASIGTIRFTDQDGNDLEPDVDFGRRVYEEGATVYFEVADEDRNLNLNAVDEIEIEIRHVDGDVEQVMLTETGVATGVFTGSIPTLGRTGVEGDGVLNAIAGPNGSAITVTWEGIEVELGHPAAEDTVLVVDTTAPAALATELDATSGPHGATMQLDWSAYDEAAQIDVAGYNVWMSDRDFTDTTGMTPVNTDPIPAGTDGYVVTGLTVDETYWFAVSAYDEVPNEDPNVNAVSATTSDSAAPYLDNEDPAPGAAGVAIDTTISFDVLDEGVGVDESTIRVWVDDEEVTADIAVTPTAGGFTVNYDSPADFEWNAFIAVRVQADDRVGNQLDTTWTFDTREDTTPPEVTQRAFDAAAGTMSFRLTDDLSGVDSSTIVLLVNGVDVTEDATIDDRNPLTVIVSYEAPDGWGFNKTVEFAVDAADNAGNVMETDMWQRDSRVDETGPLFDQFVPGEDALAAAVDTVVSVRVYDTGSGVDRDSITLAVNDADVTAELAFDDAAGASGMDQTVVTWDPGEDFDYEVQYTVAVTASDMEGNSSQHQWNFTTADEPTFEIRGTVTDANGDPMAGVEVTVGGVTVGTDGNGAYRVRDLSAGDYTVTPSMGEYDFDPASREVTVGPDARGMNFTGDLRTYEISGRITSDGAGVAGVAVTDGSRTATTDADGYYTIADVPSGDYTITAARDADDDGAQDFTYTPNSRAVNVAGAPVTDVNFTANLVTYSISGTISDNHGSRISGVAVSDGIRTAVTNEAGQFTISNVPPSTVTLTPTKSGVAFNPQTLEITVPPHATDSNFTAYTEFRQRFNAGVHMVAVPATPPTGRDRAVDIFATNQVARWDAQSTPSGYVFGSNAPDSDILAVRPGSGFFVNFPGITDVTVPGDGVSEATRFSVGVAPGWNQVGNMYETALPLANISGAGSTEIRPFAFVWDNTIGSYRMISGVPAFNSARTYIEPWEAAWFRATGAAGTLDITGPANVAAASMLNGAAAQAEAPDHGWLTPIIATVANRADVTTVAGVGSGDASRGYRIENPPMMPGSVDVYFTRESGARLAHDIRPRDAGSMVWPFAVETDIADAEVEITLPDLSGVPSEMAVYLTDLDSGKRMYARTLPAYTFTSGADGALRHFELEVAPRGADNLAIRSASVQTGNGGLMVTYDLSSAANVSIEILNIAGRSVRELIQSRATSVGTNEQMWDLRSADGTIVPNGSYLIRIEAVADNGQRVQALRPAQIMR